MNSKNAGFSLLEAIVAMVLIATAGLALFSWINTSFISLNRIQAANAQAAAEMNALQFMQTVNPMLTPSGNTTLGRLKIEWQARPASEVRRNVTDSELPGPFQVALYDTDVTVEELPDVPRYHLSVKLLGYERDAFVANPFADSAPGKKPAAARVNSGK
jgi:general secretion pathway protein I